MAPPTSAASSASTAPPARSRRGVTRRSPSFEGKGEDTQAAEYRKGYNQIAVPHPPALKASLKRGAFIAAANWPLIAVQFIAEGTLKLLLAVPVVGGIFLVVLLLGADAEEVMAGDLKQIVTSVVAALRANPIALAAFGAAFLVVLLGASALTFIVKGGTIAILAEAEAHAGPIERPPLRLAALRRANVTNIEPFLAGCRRLAPRYLKLGACLLIAYTATAAGFLFLGFLVGGYAFSGSSGMLGAILGGIFAAPLAFSVLVVWITLINFLYLLTQMAIAVEDVGVREGMRRVAQFIRGSLREVAAVFGVVLLLVAITTIASLLATAGLGLIAVIPFLGLAMVPLQLGAWVLRGIVFEYLALTALGAYLTQYRYYLHSLALLRVHDTASDVTDPRLA
jgi:hypothetical protein